MAANDPQSSRSQKPLDIQEHRIWVGLLVGGLVCLLVVLLLSIRSGKEAVKQDAADTLDLVKATCQKYNDYQLGITTKDLQAILNKANTLSLYAVGKTALTAEDLAEYAELQYLTGIFLLDGDGNPAMEVSLADGSEQTLLQFILSGQQPEEILDYPKKVYAGHTELEGRSYDYAIVARQDAAGLLICYADTTLYQGDKYELSLSSMLSGDAIGKDAVVVVTDGTTVLSSTVPKLEGLAVSECPVTNVLTDDLLKEDSDLIKLNDNGRLWYGQHGMYRDKYLYVFYPSEAVFSNIYFPLGLAMGLYLLFCLLFALYLQSTRKAKLQQEAKEYHLVNAVASIYDINLMIHPAEGTWSPILQTPRLKEAVSGLTNAQEMLNTFADRLIQPADREEFRRFTDLASLSQRMAGKPFLGTTFESVTGTWYQALLVPQDRGEKLEGDVSSVMLLLRNVTEQKERELRYQEQLREAAEQADLANAAKSEFLRRMSHDIRTPINGIRGMAEIGKANCQDPERAADCFEKILTSSDFLLALVRNVLDMSKLEAGEAENDQEPFDLRDVMKGTETIIALQAAEAGIRFQCDPLAGEHWKLTGSPLNIQRVLQNIMSNAVKYNRPGGLVQVSCRENHFDGDTATFTFVCADTGLGMSPEFQAQAFETFTQEAKDSARTTYSGSGLGLAIAKKTVELMGGTIGFVSREGKGTVFTITLPLKVDPNNTDDEAEEAAGSIEGVRVLLAEDNGLNREIVTYMLTEKGAVVTEAENGKQAVDLFAASAPGDFDVVLMDIMMPVMNGLDAANAIRAMERPDADIPIIAVTANAFSDDILASKSCGINEHLSKPLDYAKVTATICKYLGR